jgi:hypothetical protein
MKIEIWDLEKFTGYDAYGSGEHFGNMWTNYNGNTVGVVPPMVLLFKQKHKTEQTPEQTTMQGRVNTMRKNGTEIVLDSGFKGNRGSGMKGRVNNMRALTSSHIWRSARRRKVSSRISQRSVSWRGSSPDAYTVWQTWLG